MNCDDLVDFAYSVYNNIINTDIDSKSRKNLIKLATSSLVKGNQIKTSSEQMKR